jgi:16S rRNA (adenine1518-N6/adenine1519-N6)-dimethyltransferase
MPGQTVSEIRSLLAAAGLSPQHRFGQNFLVDLNLMRKLVQRAELCAADVVLEVGPGTGSLTEILLETGARVIAVEIDRGFQEILENRLAQQERFTLLRGDALAGKNHIQPAVLETLRAAQPGPGGARKLVANLPYQIATPLLIELLYVTPAVTRMTCTIQKEVGLRLAAAARSDAYGPISVLMQTLADVHTVAHLPPHVFWPVPGVESIMVDIRPHARSTQTAEKAAAFAEFVHRGFQQRRKMLRRILSDFPPDEADRIFSEAGVTATQRPEELSPATWQALHRAALQRRPAR